jgi:hypothetical protein
MSIIKLENKMFKKLFRGMVVSRQVSAAETILSYLSDSQLADLGYNRNTFVETNKARLIAELDAANARLIGKLEGVNRVNVNLVSVNPNLLGAV